MRHKVFGNQLGRNTKQARALYRGLTRDLFIHGRIETTLAKAKAIVLMVDRVITLAKKNSVSARREVSKILGSENPVSKIFNEIAPAFTSRNSGYTRIIRLRNRFSDTTQLAIIELVERAALEPKKVEIKDKQSLRSSQVYTERSRSAAGLKSSEIQGKKQEIKKKEVKSQKSKVKISSQKAKAPKK